MGKKKAGKAAGVAAVEHRKHPRVPLNLLVQFRVDTYDVFLERFAPNISVGGMFIETDAPREEGTALFFQFVAGDVDDVLIEGMGRVVRVVRTEGAEGGRKVGMGIEFTSLSEGSRARIEALVQGRVAA